MSQTKINSLATLRAEKERLRILSDKHQQQIQADMEWIKAEYAPMELLNKLAQKMVPEPVRHSSFVNSPINYLAQTLFKQDENIVHRLSDKGKGNQVRNIALALAEGVGTYLVTRYIRRRLGGR